MIRVLLVDDHAIVREGYRRLIEKHADIQIVAEGADAAQAYEAYKAHHPDVVIMDISMPGRGGIDAIRHIRQRDPSAQVLVFSMHSGASYALQSFRAGAKGYVTKSSPPDVLIGAIRRVAAGKPTLCPEISQALAAAQLAEEANILDELSPREFEVLRMLLDGQSTDAIAIAFNLSPKTIANYHYTIKTKMSAASDIDLVLRCMRLGLLTSGEDGQEG
jgi:two-component system, NarL family, invasion response regulator UvrY